MPAAGRRAVRAPPAPAGRHAPTRRTRRDGQTRRRRAGRTRPTGRPATGSRRLRMRRAQRRVCTRAGDVTSITASCRGAFRGLHEDAVQGCDHSSGFHWPVGEAARGGACGIGANDAELVVAFGNLARERGLLARRRQRHQATCPHMPARPSAAADKCNWRPPPARDRCWRSTSRPFLVRAADRSRPSIGGPAVEADALRTVVPERPKGEPWRQSPSVARGLVRSRTVSACATTESGDDDAEAHDQTRAHRRRAWVTPGKGRGGLAGPVHRPRPTRSGRADRAR